MLVKFLNKGNCSFKEVVAVKRQEIARIRECIAQLLGAAMMAVSEVQINKDWQQSEIDEVVERLVRFMRYPWAWKGFGAIKNIKEAAEKVLEEMNNQRRVSGGLIYLKAQGLVKKALSQFLEEGE